MDNNNIDLIEVVLKNCSELLGVEVELLNLESNLFSLGGDSLKLSQLIGSLQELYGVEVPLDELYGSPTIGTLTKLIACEISSETIRGEKLNDELW